MNTVECPAKINLYLRIHGKRDDGYHQVETLLQTIDLSDTLSWQPGERPLELEVVGADLGDPRENLVIRAARAFSKATGIEVRGRFQLHKRIPAGGGLGGGSSNAAAALNLINAQHGYPLERGRLHVLASSLGADVPFFLAGGTCLGLGRGCELTSQSLPEGIVDRGFAFLLPVSLATSEVYRAYRHSAIRDSVPPRVGENDLLASALEVSTAFAAIWHRLRPHFGGGPFFMTGSGSSLVWLTERGSLDPQQKQAVTAVNARYLPFRFK